MSDTHTNDILGSGGVPDVAIVPAWQGSHVVEAEDDGYIKIELDSSGYPPNWFLVAVDEEGYEGCCLSIDLATMKGLSEIFAAILESYGGEC